MCKGPGEGRAVGVKGWDGAGEGTSPPHLCCLAGVQPFQHPLPGTTFPSPNLARHCSWPSRPPSGWPLSMCLLLPALESLITQRICSLGGIWGLIRLSWSQPQAWAASSDPTPLAGMGWPAAAEGHSAGLASLLQGPAGLPLLLHTFPSTPYKSKQTHLLLTGPFLGLSVPIWGCGIVGPQMLGQGTEARLPLNQRGDMNVGLWAVRATGEATLRRLEFLPP